MTPSPQPKLPAWIFIVTDLALLAVAGYIATHSTHPFSDTTTASIVFCVIAGAITGLVPLVARYEYQKNETLDDRQRALESLARTLTSAAEQISIAASGLNEITELTQKNLRHAEKLPHQLQDKIAEFQAGLAAANDAEKEELEKEVAALRTTESERLDSISDKIAKSTSEWVKLEAVAQKRLAASADTLAKIQSDAGALDSKLTATLAVLDAKVVALEVAAKSLSAPPAPPPPAPAETEIAGTVSPPTASADSPVLLSPKSESTAHPPKRPRKPRREEPVAEDAAVPSPANESVAAVSESHPPVPAESVSAETPAVPAPLVEEPPPVPAATIPEVAPVAPDSAEPFSGHIGTIPAADPVATPVTDATVAEPAKPARKRAPKKPAPEPGDTSFSLDIAETPAAETAEVTERARTSDGATRLLVTAYIGIGNRLFIRGEGPGLNWDKGIPLQFVSIGKWRWESNDASAPVKFKLYKNDDTECAALGTQSLDAGHQQEVTAAF